MDINRALRNAVKSGKVYFGVNEARAAIRDKSAKMVIVAENCPDKEVFLSTKDVSVVEFDGNRAELGSACGKPFHVSIVTVIDAGDSQILSA